MRLGRTDKIAEAKEILTLIRGNSQGVVAIGGGAQSYLTIIDGGWVGLGSSSARISFSSTGNAVMLYSAADLIVYSDAGSTEMMRIDGATGSIGIGIASPVTPLHIYGSQNAQAIFESTDAYSAIWIKDGGTSSDYEVAVGALNDDMYLNAGGTTELYIEDGGSIGVSTAAPSSAMEFNLSTANLEIVDSGTAGATEDGWVQIEIGGATHYLRSFTSK